MKIIYKIPDKIDVNALVLAVVVEEEVTIDVRGFCLMHEMLMLEKLKQVGGL